MATLVMLDSRDLEIARLRAALARANQGQKGEAEARKRDEELQFASDFYGRTVIDNIPGFVVILATGGILEACNRPVLEYAGLTFEELREWKSTGFVHPDDLPRIVEHLSGTIVAGVPYEHELRLRRFDGDFRWFSSRGVPIQDGADNVVRRYCALLIDIEDRKRAETELRFAFAHLSEAQRLSKTGSFIADMADQRSWSDEAYRIFEFEPGTKVTLDRIRDTVHPEDRAMIDRVFERAAPGIDADFLFRIVTASGVVKHVHGAAHVLEKVGARPSLVGALQDVTESKLAEQALKQSEANLQRTLAQLSEAQRLSKTGSYTNNLAKEEFVWSDELYRIFDFEPGSKITVQRVRECVYPEDLQSFQTAVDWARQGLITDPIFRIFSTNGVVKHLRTIKKIEPKTDGSFEVTGAIQDITESKLTEQALETKAEELRRALTHLSEAQRLSKTGSFTADLMRDEHYWSEELYRICGFELGSKITIQRFEDIVHPDDQAALRTTIESGLNDADSVDILVRLITPEGLKHVHFVARRMAEYGAGRVFVGAVQDVTEATVAKEALADSEQSLRQMVNSIPGMVAVFSTVGETEFVNQHALNYFGATQEDIRDWEGGAYTHPEDNERSAEDFRRSLALGEPYEAEVRARRYDGVYRWFQTRVQPLRDASGRIVRWYNLLTDIDDRKRAEAELHHALAHLTEAQRLSKTGSFITDMADERNWSDEVYRIFEFEAGTKVTPQRILDVVHPEDLAGVAQVLEQAKPNADFLFRIVTASGTLKYVRGIYHVMETDGARPSFVGALQDVTESKLAENALRLSEAFLAQGEAVSETGSFLWNLATDEIRWSKQLYHIFEFESDLRITLEQISKRIHPQDMHMLTDPFQRAYAGLDSEYEYRLLMPDGTIKYLRFVGQFRRDQDGHQEYIGTVQDITRRKMAERDHDRVRSELTHAARAMSLSVLTASLAHEINQPLASMITNAYTCVRTLGSDPPNVKGAAESAHRMIRDGNRASEVISRLRSLFSKKEFATETVDLSEAAREVLTLSAHELQRHQVAVSTEFDEDPINVVGDRVQIQQVILNLLLNARDAVKDVEERLRTIVVRTDKDGAGSGRISVRDTGVGIALELRDKIFEAFYTTKGDGMGIGLSISRSIIERHQGRLWAEPNDGPGTTFSFSIPIKDQSY